MKLTATILIAVVCAVTFCATPKNLYSIDDEKQQMTQYQADIKQAIDCEEKQFAELKQNCDQENSKTPKYTKFNENIIQAYKDKISVMKQMLESIQNNDKKQIEQLEDQKAGIEYKINIESLKKDMESTVDNMEQNATQYPQESPEFTKLSSCIQQVKYAYANIIKTEKNLYKLNQQLKQYSIDKHNAINQYEIINLDAQKEQKIKEMKN